SIVFSFPSMVGLTGAGVATEASPIVRLRRASCVTLQPRTLLSTPISRGARPDLVLVDSTRLGRVATRNRRERRARRGRRRRADTRPDHRHRDGYDCPPGSATPLPPRPGRLVSDGAERRTHVDLVVVQQTEEEAAVGDEPVCADADAAPRREGPARAASSR